LLDSLLQESSELLGGVQVGVNEARGHDIRVIQERWQTFLGGLSRRPRD